MVSSYHANHELTIGILSIKILYNTNRFYNRLNRDPTPHTDDLRIPHIHIVISFPVVEIQTTPSSFSVYLFIYRIYFPIFICIPDLFHIFKIISFFSEFLLTFCIL